MISGVYTIQKESRYRARSDFVNFDSARQCQIEAKRPERRGQPLVGLGEEEDRFGEVVASQNLQNPSLCGIYDKT